MTKSMWVGSAAVVAAVAASLLTLPGTTSALASSSEVPSAVSNAGDVKETAPGARGAVNWGIHKDGWTVRMFNDDDTVGAVYSPTKSYGVRNAPNIAPGTSNTVKGMPFLFIGESPADALIQFAVGSNMVEVELRADADGTTHHECRTSGTAKCVIDPTPLDEPVEVHFLHNLDLSKIDFGVNAVDGHGWVLNIDNRTSRPAHVQFWNPSPLAHFPMPSGKITAPAALAPVGGNGLPSRQGYNVQLDFDTITLYPQFMINLGFDDVGRLRHTCEVFAGREVGPGETHYNCSVLPGTPATPATVVLEQF